METGGSKEQLDASDTCGCCGRARRDHLPVWSSHPKCKNFSDPNVRRSRRSEERPSIAAGSPEVPYIEQSPSVNAPLKETIRDQAIWRGPGRRSYQHSGLFLFADHLSHPRQDVPWEHFQGETLARC